MSLYVVGIDPGNDTGYALIKDGELVNAGLGDPRYEFEPENWLYKVYIECPRIYPTGTPNPNDLIKLAVMVGRYDEFFRGANLIAPSDWKGQLPKEVTARRARARFPDLDKWLVGVAPGKRHNVLDAIGIACYGYDKEPGREHDSVEYEAKLKLKPIKYMVCKSKP